MFQIMNAAGEEIVVLLMDTQGVFDRNTTLKDSTSIFSLSVLLSSVQIFNVKQNIQADDLRHLELFVEFGRLIKTEHNPGCPEKPFQDLIFLVRDWSYHAENSYGWEGGQKVLEKQVHLSAFFSEFSRMSCECHVTDATAKHVYNSASFSACSRGRKMDQN